MTKKTNQALYGKRALKFPVATPTGKVAVLPTFQTKWTICINSWLRHFFAFSVALQRQLGRKNAHEIIRESWSLMIGEPGTILNGYRKAFGLEGLGAQMIATLGQFQSVIEGHDVEIIGNDPAKAGWRSVCVWWNEWSTRWYDGDLKNFESIICYPGCRNIWAQETRAFDPSLKVHQTKWMGSGAACCEFIIEKKKSHDDEDLIINVV